ncbi:TetR/AcrR family transcriptional regulator [Actinoplanes friuliensis]|uniref:TetR family transcriptional regulator n=1 Tax=Actinoplanes friuliensis DSM 7358 TaxID=1246995 RepID=U5W0B9_9ACTN|nr:TetR/AcrR family transcriptional regulator [Actinoplanes friuliensis]AGZ41376.1 TetR family transcriptional regulator [Actinoplanes friuliensis DSM 7358]
MAHSITTAARRAQIVEAAIDTIVELGYDKASYARITERAGLSSPRLISYHFANKDDLIRQILVDVYTTAARLLGERIAREGTAGERLTAYLEGNVDFLREHPREVAALTAIGPHLRDDEGKPYTSASAQEPDVQALAGLLSEGQRSGEFRDFDTRSMAVLIRGAITAAVQRLHDGLDFDAYRRELVTTFRLATRRDADATG